MSFSNKVKNELCKFQLNKPCCIKAEIMGILLFSNIFTSKEIRIITENHDFSLLLPKLFKKCFDIEFDKVPDFTLSGNKMVFQITDSEKISYIINELDFDARQFLSPHLNFGLIEDDCCKYSFLRGAFLCGGSITDPEKRYHLELCTSHMQIGKEIRTLLLDMGIESGISKRGPYCVIYFKQSETIEDLLTAIGSPACAVDIMTAKIDKEIRNDANRAINCDIANVNKTIEAAQSQLEAIDVLYNTGAIKKVPECFLETIKLRKDNPELSLVQLAAMHNPPISKSCINHRLRKIIEIAKK